MTYDPAQTEQLSQVIAQATAPSFLLGAVSGFVAVLMGAGSGQSRLVPSSEAEPRHRQQDPSASGRPRPCPQGDAWESLQPCTLTEGSSSVRLGPSSSRNPPDHIGTAERCGTEFLDGFSGIGSRPKRPSREDQFVDSAPRRMGRAGCGAASAGSEFSFDTAASSADCLARPASWWVSLPYRPASGAALAYTAAETPTHPPQGPGVTHEISRRSGRP
jgi:hypothetical protein